MGKAWQHLTLQFFLTFDWLLFQWGIEVSTAPNTAYHIANQKLSASRHVFHTQS